MKTEESSTPWLGFGISQYVLSNYAVYSTTLFADYEKRREFGFSYGLSSSFTFSIRSYTEVPKDYRSGDLLLRVGVRSHGLGLYSLLGVSMTDVNGGDVKPTCGVEAVYDYTFGSDASLGLGTRFMTLSGVYVWTPLVVRYSFRLGGDE
ncbi:MAG: hypothetical protein KBS81_07815 [Spirochaetales bacterium]|nr:hypothetical protein [Candidatus Physcosoma equi]